MLSEGVSELQTSSLMIWSNDLRGGVSGGWRVVAKATGRRMAPLRCKAQSSCLGRDRGWPEPACQVLWSCLLLLSLSEAVYPVTAPCDHDPGQELEDFLEWKILLVSLLL